MITLENVHKIYNPKKANEFEALKGVSLTIEDGEMVAIIGKSGAGKSTLLHILACIDSYESGEYKIDDTLVKNLSEKQYAQIRNEKIGMVMQDFALVDDFTCLENVLLPLDFAKHKKPYRKEVALAALMSVSMDSMAKKPVNKLSGGQKQRVAIAGIIAMRPDCIVLDEPTAMLDPAGRREVMKTIRRLNRENGITIILITHYMDEAAQAERVVVMDKGKIILDDTPSEVFSHVDMLREVGLDVPQVTQLMYLMDHSGFEGADTHIINEEECADYLYSLLSANR